MQTRLFRTLALVLCVLSAACRGGGETAAPRPPRVMVFGIDGGTWDVIEPMMREGQLPHLKRLYDLGIHGVLETQPHSSSPVVWTTIFTGRPPSEHGVQGWETAVSTNRRVSALWEIVSRLGLAAHVFNVPGSWPPDRINGAMFGGFPLSESVVGEGTGIVVRADGLRARGLPEVVRSNAGPIATSAAPLPAGAWSDWLEFPVPDGPSWRCTMRVRRLDAHTLYLSPCYRVDEGFAFAEPGGAVRRVHTATGRWYVPEGPGWSRYAERWTLDYLDEHLTHVARIQSDAAAVFAADPWRLFIFVDTLVDRVSHAYWPYQRPQDYEGVAPAKALQHAEAVRDAYRETDRALGTVLAAAPGDYDVVVVSDHGFQSNSRSPEHTGRHHADGIYLISSTRLRSRQGQRAYIEDVTPTLLHMLGLPVARNMKGRVLPEVALDLARPVESVATLEGAGRLADQRPVDDSVWEQLKALGYVGGAAPGAGTSRRR